MTAVDPVGDALASLAASRSVVTPSSTAERVADAIREEVVAARLRAGDRLPEQDLGESLQVSRNTVREALSQLVAERVLVRVPHRGVFVARPDSDDVRDVYRARLVIEPGAVRHGERADDPVAVGRLRAAVRSGREAAATDDWVGVADANQRFHRAVAGLAGSPRVDQEMGRLLAEMRLVFQRMPEVREFHEPYLTRNGEIATLLEGGRRAAAADEVAEYLAAARDQLLAAYRRL